MYIEMLTIKIGEQKRKTSWTNHNGMETNQINIVSIYFAQYCILFRHQWIEIKL